MPETKSGTIFNVRVFPFDEPKGSAKAFASVTFEDFVAIHNMRVIEGKNGLFVSVPSEKGTDGKYRDVAFPTTGELSKEVYGAILDEYRALTGSRAREASAEEKRAPDEARRDALSQNFSVRIYKIDNPKGNTKAFASVSFEDIMAIRGVRVVDGKNGLFVTMPQSKDKDGNYRDVAFPTTGELRKEITRAVLEAYENEVSKDTAKETTTAENEKPGLMDRLGEMKAQSAKAAEDGKAQRTKETEARGD